MFDRQSRASVLRLEATCEIKLKVISETENQATLLSCAACRPPGDSQFLISRATGIAHLRSCIRDKMPVDTANRRALAALAKALGYDADGRPTIKIPTPEQAFPDSSPRRGTRRTTPARDEWESRDVWDGLIHLISTPDTKLTRLEVHREMSDEFWTMLFDALTKQSSMLKRLVVVEEISIPVTLACKVVGMIRENLKQSSPLDLVEFHTVAGAKTPEEFELLEKASMDVALAILGSPHKFVVKLVEDWKWDPPTLTSKQVDLEASARGYVKAAADLPLEQIIELNAKLISLGDGELGWEQCYAFAVEVAIAFSLAARELRSTDPERASTLVRGGVAMQLALCGVLTDPKRGVLSFNDSRLPLPSAKTLDRAATGGCKELLALPLVQAEHDALFFEGHIWEIKHELTVLRKRKGERIADEDFSDAFCRLMKATVDAVGYFLLSLVLFPLLVLCPPLLYVERARWLVEWTQLDKVFFTSPAGRLALDWAAGALLVFVMMKLPPSLSTDRDEDLGEFALLAAVYTLLASVGALVNELEELVGLGLLRRPGATLRHYTSDHFNVYELAGLVLALAVCVPHVVAASHYATLDPYIAVKESVFGRTISKVGESDLIDGDAIKENLNYFTYYVHVTRSAAVLFLSFRLMRIFYLSASLGPLMLTIQLMLRDTLRLVFLAVPIMFSFAISQHVLFDGTVPTGEQGCATVGDPDLQMDAEEDFRLGPLKAFVVELEIFLGNADSRLECMRLSSAGYSAWVLQTMYMLVSVVLLLNMLIAVLAKSARQRAARRAAHTHPCGYRRARRDPLAQQPPTTPTRRTPRAPPA